MRQIDIPSILKNLNNHNYIAAWKVVLASSIAIVLFHNFGFWKYFFNAVGGLDADNGFYYISAFLILALTFNAFLSLVNFKYLIKPILILIFLVSASADYFINSYGIVIDPHMMQNVIETDVREAKDLLTWSLAASILFFGVLPSIAIWWVQIKYPPFLRGVVLNIGTTIACLSMAGLILFSFFKVLAPTLRENRQMRFLLTPTNVVQASRTIIKRSLELPVTIKPWGIDATKDKLWFLNQRRTVTVVVVGESARSMNFSLNGYSRNTNPMLSQQPDLINFTSMQSCGTATAISVPCVFSGYTREEYSENNAKSREGLLDIINRTGIDVIWLDNNSGCKGVCDRVYFEDLSKPKNGEEFCNNEECFDERLLKRLPEIIENSKKDLFIILHQKGSHGPAYWKRHPPAFEVFTPACKSSDVGKCSRESIIAAYDNTILYTDHFLNKTIDLLRTNGDKFGVDTAMIYFSDHGESLGEKNIYLHGAPYMFSPDEQRHVPFMLWFDSGYKKRFAVNQQCLEGRKQIPLSHDNVFHSMLGLLNIRTNTYNQKLDLFYACKDTSIR